MNEAYLIIQMQEAVNKLTRLTRASRNVDHMEIRKICVNIENYAHELWKWSMDKEDEMPIQEWRAMRDRHMRSEA
jgi:seryl-tRNA synthetase